MNTKEMKLVEERESEHGPIRIYACDYYYIPELNLNVYTGGEPKDGYIKRVHKAMCTYEESSNMYTMFSIDKGGPVICKPDLGEIVCGYKEMFIFSLAVKCLVDRIKEDGGTI